MPSSNMGSDMVPPSENSETQPRMVIWGTDVQLNECKRKFKVFIQSFQVCVTLIGEEFYCCSRNPIIQYTYKSKMGARLKRIFIKKK